MWKDSIRNIVVIFQPNILKIVGLYVRHSAYMFQHPFFSLFQIELINASLLDNLEKLLAGLKVINLSLYGFAKPLKVLLCNFSHYMKHRVNTFRNLIFYYLFVSLSDILFLQVSVAQLFFFQQAFELFHQSYGGLAYLNSRPRAPKQYPVSITVLTFHYPNKVSSDLNSFENTWP